MRKYYLISILFLSLTSQILPQQQTEIPWPTLADSPWPMMSHDPQGTGRSPYIGPKTPNVIWTLDMPYGIYSGPAIGEDGTLYFGSNTFLQGVDTTNYFYAASPSGNLKWIYLTDDIFSTNSGFLVGSDSTIYFGSQSGLIHAIDLQGNRRWVYDTGFNVWSSIMNIDLQGNIYFPNAGGYLHSMNGNGELNWRINFNSGFDAASPVIAPDGQTIYIGGRDSNFYALNLDGSVKWTFSCDAVWCNPMVDNEGNIYFAPRMEPNVVYSLTSDGEIRWEYFLPDLTGAPALYSGFTMDTDGNIYFRIYDFVCECSGISSIDYYGNFRWTYLFDDPIDDVYVPLMCDADGTIYCGSTWGNYYYAIDKDGELLWKLPLDGCWDDNSGSIGADGTLYIGVHKHPRVIGQERTLIAVRDSGSVFVDEGPFLIEYSLSQNYPNPFNPKTTINYEIPELSFVTLKVYDVLGGEVATLVNEEKSVGSYELEFNTTYIPSGVYFYRLQAGDFVEIKKMVFIK